MPEADAMTDRIAFISEHASPLAVLGGVDAGGQNVYIDRVSRALARNGVLVDVFTRWADPDLPRYVQHAPGVRVVHVEAGPKVRIPKEELFPWMDAFAADMQEIMRTEAAVYDVVHAHFWMSGYVAMLLKQQTGIPFVITFHALGKVRRMYQGADDGFPDVRFRIEELVVREASRVLAECPQDREDLLIQYFADRKKLIIVPCGFDREEFHPLDRSCAAARIGIDPAEKVILQLGRMVPRKGVDNVVRALAHLVHDHGCAAKLLVVGGESDEPDPLVTPEIGRLATIAEDLGVRDQVMFKGRRGRNELKYFYNAADVFVSTPWYEPFGITILEAMACGVPVIGANVGGIKFSIEHDHTGFLVPPDAPDILATRLKELLDNPLLARHFSRNAIDRVNRHFTWDNIAHQLVRVYDELLSPIEDDVVHAHADLVSPRIQPDARHGSR